MLKGSSEDSIYENLHETVEFIRSKTQLKPRVGIILGSGMGSVAEIVKSEVTLDYSTIPYFGSTSVEGHRGRLVLGHVGDTPVALLQGRLHLYEGHSMAQVVFPTRVLSMLGVEALIVTNAAGGLSKKMSPGDFMVISDHINLMGDNPLKGKNLDQIGPRFPDMTEAYDREFLNLALGVAKKLKIPMTSGVYIGLSVFHRNLLAGRSSITPKQSKGPACITNAKLGLCP